MLKQSHLNKVNIETTVQEKAIAIPTDDRLYHKMLQRLVKEAKGRGIERRQSYKRLGKEAWSNRAAMPMRSSSSGPGKRPGS